MQIATCYSLCTAEVKMFAWRCVGLGSLVFADEVHHDNRRLAQSVC